jgi:hypothetical protein
VWAAVEDGAALGAQEMRVARRLADLLAGRRRGVLLTAAALDRRSESLPATLGVEDPRTQVERWPVAHVPRMAAGELGDPCAVPVLAVADDRTLHHRRVPVPDRRRSPGRWTPCRDRGEISPVRAKAGLVR